jgi:flagellar biogenesis protein FliO
MRIGPKEERLAAPTSGSIAHISRDQRATWMRDRSISKKTPKTSITANTVVVLCAIAALIVVLIFLESRIRRLSVHAASQSGRTAILSGRTERMKTGLNQDHVDGQRIVVGSRNRTVYLRLADAKAATGKDPIDDPSMLPE